MNLSKRLIELLQYCADGLTVVQAAKVMGVTRHTAMQYAVNIRMKLDANTMTQAVAIAIRNGLIK